VLSERGYSELGSTYTYHDETSAMVRAPMDRVFAHVDDHTRLTSHMSESSWMMGGGSMQVELDAARGQKIGSWIRLSGKILGVTLAVEEIVTERTPPRRKVWETTGMPRLLVIGRYRMGFEIVPLEAGSHVTVFIDYALPEQAVTGWLGYFLGGYYARWCTQQMVADAVRHFTSNV
jgi:Polyketide cyclase / dehydrase and lipid transport